jgi:hypothetical protein
MRLKEFNELTFDEKLFKVVDEGTFLDNYVTRDIRMNLYAIGKFFVELVYDPDINKVVEIRSFSNGGQLDKYTNGFNVE